jgi:hypothetical protein
MIVRRYAITTAVLGLVLVAALLAGTVGVAVANGIYGTPSSGDPTYTCGMRWDNHQPAGYYAWFLLNCNWIELGPGPGGRPGENPLRRHFNP